MDNDTFGQMPAFPMPAIYDPQREQVNSAYQYGCEMGLNVRQYVWLQVYAAMAAQDNRLTFPQVIKAADKATEHALARLKELA